MPKARSRRYPTGAFALIAVLGAAEPCLADTIDVDVSPTEGGGFTRYCLRITNDDANEPADRHAERTTSLHVEVYGKTAVVGDDTWRDNISVTPGWDADEEWDENAVDGATERPLHEITWVTNGAGVGPGDSLDNFCFVFKGTVAIFHWYTDRRIGNGKHVILSPIPLPPLPTDANDTDYLPDTDGDGVPDAFDSQASLPDRDSDSRNDSQDNCPSNANGAQQDADGDLLGDACDPCPSSVDCDGEGLEDGFEVLVSGTSATSANTDGDTASDKAEFDAESNPLAAPSTPELPSDGIDNDGFGLVDENADADVDDVLDIIDNCGTWNPSQADQDNDGIGDPCEYPAAQVPALPAWGFVTAVLALLAAGAWALRRNGGAAGA